MNIADVWVVLIGFLNSNFFVALVTVTVGLFAFRIYNKQQSDEKKDAANIIMQEIKNAEGQLTQAKESMTRDGLFPESVVAMNTNSWDRYGYLFIRDLTASEWQLLDNFYHKCEQFDEAIKYNKTFFKKNEEQIRVNLHKTLGDYTKELLKNVKDGFTIEDDQERAENNKKLYTEYGEEIDAFYETYMENLTSVDSKFFYRPQKPTADVKIVLDTIRLDLSTSTVGIKLSDIIDKKTKFLIF